MHKKHPLFNVSEIEKSLTDVRKNFDRLNESLEGKREKLTAEMVDQILSAYQYLNSLLIKGFDMFSPAGMYSMLELNHTVLCGTDAARRMEFHRHMLETRTRFQTACKEVRKWYKDRGRNLKPYKKAVEFYSIALSQPQMFIEGNHRTENIVMNYIMVTEGKAPFILDMDNAREYLNLSTRIKFSNRHSMMTQMTSMPKNQKELVLVLEKYGNQKYIVE